LNESANSFSHADHGSMQAVLVVVLSSHQILRD